MRLVLAATFKMSIRYFGVFGLLFLLQSTVIAQQKNISLNRFTSGEVERSLLGDSSRLVHRGCKPFLESQLNIESIHGLKRDSTKVYTNGADKLLRSHLVEIRKEDFFIAIDPLMDLHFMNEMADTSGYSDTVRIRNSTRGFQVIGDIGKQFSFETSFYENQAFLPVHLKNYADTIKVIPGMGRWKVFDGNGYDFAMASGLISYSPAKWVNVQFGHGKNFFGHGYRSLLLSDAAFNYPYVKASFRFLKNRLQYTSIYASLQTLERLPLGEVPEALYKRKGGSFNYLSWIPFSNLEIGIFEGIIWKRYDELEGTVPQDWGSLIPVIGFNTAREGLNSKNNVLVGMNMRYDFRKIGFVYGQVAVDDPSVGSIGYQIGAKTFNVLLPNLDVQVEWNSLGDFMYSSHYRLQNYVHTQQPLGHPTGGASGEILGIVSYRWKRVIAQMKYNQIDHVIGPEGNWKRDPLLDYGNIAPWPDRRIQQWEVTAGYLFNPRTNFQVVLTWMDRIEKTAYNWQTEGKFHSSVLGIAIRTNLINRYSDF